MREINVSRAGDKALTRETPAKRGRVNRYDIVESGIKTLFLNNTNCYQSCIFIVTA